MDTADVAEPGGFDRAELPKHLPLCPAYARQ